MCSKTRNVIGTYKNCGCDIKTFILIVSRTRKTLKTIEAKEAMAIHTTWGSDPMFSREDIHPSVLQMPNFG